MDGEASLEPIGDTLEKLKADPEICASIDFPAIGITITVHSAGDGEWDMITRCPRRGVIDVAKVDEDDLLFRLGAANAISSIASDARSAHAGPKLVSDVETFLASQAG